MAKLYGEIQASALMTFDKSFARSNGQPLDSTEVFYSKSAAETYAAGDVAYIGQKIVVVETKTVDNKEVTTVTHYGIEPDASLKELGALPVGDGVTVEVVNGKIQLVGLEGHSEGTYQPFLVDGEIVWRVPSSVTVEGLDGRLETAEDDIESLESIVGDASGGLVKNVSDIALDLSVEITNREKAVEAIEKTIGEVAADKTIVEMIEDAQEAATYDDTAVRKLISDEEARSKEAEKGLQDQINFLTGETDTDEIINSMKDFKEYITEHGEIAEGFRTDIDKNKEDIADEIEAREALAERVSDLETSKDAYVGADTALKNELTGLINGKVAQDDFDGLVERVGDLEDVEAEKNVIASVDDTNFEVDTDRKLKLKDLEISKVTGLQNALSGKVAAESGKRLMTDAEGEKLGGIAEGAQVNIIDDVSDEFEIGTGKILSVKKIAMAKIDQLAEEFAKKADKADTLAEYGITDAYTKTETDNLLKAITDDLGDVSEVATQAKEKIDAYEESNDERVEAIEQKLDGVEAGAQVNKLEGVKLNGTLLSIVEKAVNIPLGAGLKAAATNPEVTIASDGTLGIGKINVNKLEQATGEVLILNCGGASAQ